MYYYYYKLCKGSTSCRTVLLECIRLAVNDVVSMTCGDQMFSELLIKLSIKDSYLEQYRCERINTE